MVCGVCDMFTWVNVFYLKCSDHIWPFVIDVMLCVMRVIVYHGTLVLIEVMMGLFYIC